MGFGFYRAFEGLTHRPQSSSFLGRPYRILNMDPQKQLLWGLWVGLGVFMACGVWGLEGSGVWGLGFGPYRACLQEFGAQRYSVGFLEFRVFGA